MELSEAYALSAALIMSGLYQGRAVAWEERMALLPMRAGLETPLPTPFPLPPLGRSDAVGAPLVIVYVRVLLWGGRAQKHFIQPGRASSHPPFLKTHPFRPPRLGGVLPPNVRGKAPKLGHANAPQDHCREGKGGYGDEDANDARSKAHLNPLLRPPRGGGCRLSPTGKVGGIVD